jgi:prepilin-type N-terminal cleavage/methylation domain-containing protein/prepilin-type processing-associated H-X9-DG protein
MSRRINVKRGFTLVELLVVIGIIALLISILLPALQKAKDAANAVKCASQMKQILIATMMYAADNRSAFPVPPAVGNAYPYAPTPLMYYMDTTGGTAGVIRYDVGTLWPYLSPGANKGAVSATVQPGPASLKTIMNCPSDNEAIRIIQYGSTQAVPRNFSYSWNVLIRGYPNGGAATSVGGYDPADTSAAPKTTLVRCSSTKIILLEEASPNDGVCYIGTPSSANAVIDFNTQMNGDTDDTPSYRHGGRGNFGFGDGHVDKLDPPTMGYTVVSTQGQQATIADQKKIRQYFLPTLQY